MSDKKFSDELLRNFLLGRVDEGQREQIEDSFLVDPEIRERLLILEQELTEDYLEGSLSKQDKEDFLSRYAQTPEQRQQLQIARSLKKYAAKEAMPFVDTPNSSAVRRPVFLALVIVAIVVLVASVWVLMHSSSLETELARVNRSTSEIPRQKLKLRPVTVRGEGEQVNVTREAGIVELQLTWLQSQQYPRYRARLRRVGGDQWFTIPDLEPHDEDGYFIPVKIPAQLLETGTYQLELSGATANSPEVEYVFRVVNAETRSS